ncbi:branched-chain amino acid ABC transporter permease (plasmid) [Natrinema zhouii]|uniref:branched-chain amino acid ABC transporter permease n=1 Tax=Natrinema zhouii TaxID=1710539 RepID=UPI001CFFE057|nr:branched-chain amino acid ABC transporter permease [Natrinema zhouii]UHQ98846.1 branched-chain amino acid ABC transporter permease [Natrinema zhouii]
MSNRNSLEIPFQSWYRRFAGQWYMPMVKAIVGFSLIAVLPLLLDLSILGVSLADFFSIEILIVTLMFATMSQAWNIMTGFTGYFSFGHATFFGIGVYINLKLLIDYGINPWIGMLVAATFAALIGISIGYITFRFDLQGHYFALTTLAFALLFWALARNMTEFGGSQGLFRPFAQEYASGSGLLAFQWNGQLPYFYLILVFLVIVTVVAWAIKNSAIGVYLFAIKEDEKAAQSLGIPVFRYKIFAIGTSAFLTAIVGTFWSMFYITVTPQSIFQMDRNLEILLPAVIGGLGTIAGPIVGAIVVFPFSEIIRQTFGNIAGFDRIIYGLAIIFIVLYSPRGIVYWPKRFQTVWTWLSRTLNTGSALEESDDQ